MQIITFGFIIYGYMSLERENRFAQAVRGRQESILHERLPTPKKFSLEERDRRLFTYLKELKTLDKLPIRGINIPEVGEEARPTRPTLRVEPREIAPFLQENGIWEIVLNRRIRFLSWAEQEKWLKETYKEFGIRNFIFVGGAHSDVRYPGRTVTEAVRAVKGNLNSQLPDIFIGGITIFTRELEPTRLFKKTISGIEYFTSQLIYETKETEEVLKQYAGLCRGENVQPKMIFLSFAPVVKEENIVLLEELRRWPIPLFIKQEIDVGRPGAGERSIAVAEKILAEILKFVKSQTRKGPALPVGINVEHITDSNLELSFALLERLGDVYLNEI